MDKGEKIGWTNIITADDLDTHLIDIGQAKVNASIVAQMLTDFPLNNNATLLIPGCGTGQIFD